MRQVGPTGNTDPLSSGCICMMKSRLWSRCHSSICVTVRYCWHISYR